MSAQTGLPLQELGGALPPDVTPREIRLTADGRRTYFRTPAGNVRLHDRESGGDRLIVPGPVRNLDLSPTGDALAYVRDDDAGEPWVRALDLDPETGLPAGEERRLGSGPGDVPAFSPDGRRVAYARNDSTGVGQSVVVLPADGGAERVVAGGQPSSLRGIWWMPDGKTVYFGVNGEVGCSRCLPAGSLPLPAKDDVAPTIRRASLDSAGVSVIATTADPFPGLSPDGSVIVYADTEGRAMVVADADGRRLDTFDVPAYLRPIGWFSGSEMLTLSSGRVHRILSMPLDGGPTRLIVETGDPAWTNPAWSPDGTKVLFTRWLGDRCELVIVDAERGEREAVDLEAGRCRSAHWSPDGRRVVYRRTAPGERWVLTVLDLETGQSRNLYQISADVRAQLGPIDNGGVTVSELEEGRARLVYLSFAGGRQILGEHTFPAGAEITGVFPVDRSTAIVRRGSANSPEDYRLFRFGSGEAGAEGASSLVTFNGESINRRLSLSHDRRWVAFLYNPDGLDWREMNWIDLVKLDGIARHSVTLPFSAPAVFPRPLIAPGGDALVVTRRTGAAVHVVDVASGATRKLFEPPGGRWPVMALSPDGSTLIYVVTEEVDPSVFTVDVSALLEDGGR